MNFSFVIQNNKKQYILILVIFSVYVYMYTKLESYLFHYDDAYITYVFAKNFSLGHGIVYHPEFQPVQGSSTLLYTILLGSIGYVTKIEIAKIGFYLYIILFFSANIIFLHVYLSSQSISKKITFLIFLISFPMTSLLGLGMESSWMIFLIILLIYLIENKKPVLSGLLMGFIFLSRMDFVIFSPLLLFLKEKKKILQSTTFLIGSIIVYISFSKAYFGSILPNTWIAKSYFQNTIGRESFLTFLNNNSFFYSYIIIAILGILYIIIKKFHSRKHILLLVVFILSILHIIILEIKGATAMPWYFVVPVNLCFWIFSYFLKELKISYKFLITIIFLTALFNTVFAYTYYTKHFFSEDKEGKIIWDKRGHNDRREIAGKYLAYIDQNISNKVVLFFEAGKIPYYSGCKGVDLLGLASPEAISGLIKNDASITFFASNPDYVVGVNAPFYFPMTFIQREEFKNNYEVLLTIQDYTIWKRKQYDTKNQNNHEH